MVSLSKAEESDKTIKKNRKKSNPLSAMNGWCLDGWQSECPRERKSMPKDEMQDLMIGVWLEVSLKQKKRWPELITGQK